MSWPQSSNQSPGVAQVGVLLVGACLLHPLGGLVDLAQHVVAPAIVCAVLIDGMAAMSFIQAGSSDHLSGHLGPQAVDHEGKRQLAPAGVAGVGLVGTLVLDEQPGGQ